MRFQTIEHSFAGTAAMDGHDAPSLSHASVEHVVENLPLVIPVGLELGRAVETAEYQENLAKK